MNDLLNAFYQEWRWAFWIAGLAIGQLMNVRRSASLRRQLRDTKAQLESTTVQLTETLDQERKIRQTRDSERETAFAMIQGYL